MWDIWKEVKSLEGLCAAGQQSGAILSAAGMATCAKSLT